MPAPRLLLTREQAAAALGISLDTFKRHVEPHLAFVVIGRRKQVPMAEIERWVELNTVSVPA